jgi:hypothetical protein
MATAFDRFIAEARELRGPFFERNRPITAARAPGWVDLIGASTADAGTLGLGYPLGFGACVALQPAAEPAVRLRDADGLVSMLPLATLAQADGEPRPYGEIAGRIAHLPAPLRLVAAAYTALLREEFVRFPAGARLLLRVNNLPGWELAVVTAVAQALVSAYGVRIAPRELGLSSRVGLLRVAGLAHDPGALGALTSVCAPPGALLMLHQQPAWIWGNLHLPQDICVWAVRVGDGPSPRSLSVATAMAYRLAAEAADLAPAAADSRWLGYLSNLGVPAFARAIGALLPRVLRGADFLARYGSLPGLRVQPDEGYPVRAAAAYALEEHQRARTTMALLRAASNGPPRDDDVQLVGELLTQSHWAGRAAGLADAHADRLVDLLTATGDPALLGARAPASASGATLVVLGRAGAVPALRSIVERYAEQSGLPVDLFSESVAGCSPAGTRTI